MRLFHVGFTLSMACLVTACMGVAEMDSPLPDGDAGQPTDAPDAGLLVDAGVLVDGGSNVDAGLLDDAGVTHDAGQADDAGVSVASDAGGLRVDAGVAMPDAGADLVTAFVSIGKQGRRAISCDDGNTWVNDVAFDDALPVAQRFRCFSGNFALPDGGTNNTDCDHNGWSSTGLSASDGVLMHTMGWGAPGTFHRSTDGVTWSHVFTGANVQGVLAGPTRWVAATRSTRVSSDRGVTWSSGPELMLSSGGNTIWNVRGGAFGDGTALVVAQDGQNTDWQRSRDEGLTWQRPTLVGGGRVDACGVGAPVFGNGVWLVASWNQAQTRMVVCRSTDDGATWALLQGPTDAFESRILWTQAGFIAWSNGRVHRSPDGLTWTSSNSSTRRNGATSGGPNIGAVAFSQATGTFAAVRGGWQVWYEQQRFYRSTDGVIWDELPESAARRSHPITHLISARVQRSAVCP